MKITAVNYYGGGRQKLSRLGLMSPFLELQQILLSTDIPLEDSAGGDRVREVTAAISASFSAKEDWLRVSADGTHRSKRILHGRRAVTRLHVDVQLSAGKDGLIGDVVHLRNSLQKAEIDVGVIVVPDDRMQKFLPDRTPSFTDAVRYIEVEFKEAMTFPIVVMAIEHDSPGKAIPKKTINLGSGKS